jgi:ankyrin repeat protein
MPDVVDAFVYDGGGRTMLMYAVSENGGWLALVTLLISAGADVNRRDPGGRPVWDFAPTSGPGCVEVWRVLINAGFDVNSRGVKNETPLISICAVSDPAIVQLLLDAGAEVNVVDKYNDSPLSAAASWPGNIKVVKILLKVAHVVMLS